MLWSATEKKFVVGEVVECFKLREVVVQVY